MKQFRFKKSISLDKTPILLPLEPLYLRMESVNTEGEQSRRLPARAASFDNLDQLVKNAPNPSSRPRSIMKSLSEDKLSGDYSSASTVIITETELASSWLYKNRKAAVESTPGVENSSLDTVSPTAPMSTDELAPVVLQDPRMKPIPVQTARPEDKSSCCCYLVVMLIICFCSLGLMTAIGGIIYMEIFAANREPMISSTLSPETDELLEFDVRTLQSVNEVTTTRNEHSQEQTPVDSQSPYRKLNFGEKESFPEYLFPEEHDVESNRDLFTSHSENYKESEKSEINQLRDFEKNGRNDELSNTKESSKEMESVSDKGLNEPFGRQLFHSDFDFSRLDKLRNVVADNFKKLANNFLPAEDIDSQPKSDTKLKNKEMIPKNVSESSEHLTQPNSVAQEEKRWEEDHLSQDGIQLDSKEHQQFAVQQVGEQPTNSQNQFDSDMKRSQEENETTELKAVLKYLNGKTTNAETEVPHLQQRAESVAVLTTEPPESEGSKDGAEVNRNQMSVSKSSVIGDSTETFTLSGPMVSASVAPVTPVVLLKRIGQTSTATPLLGKRPIDLQSFLLEAMKHFRALDPNNRLPSLRRKTSTLKPNVAPTNKSKMNRTRPQENISVESMHILQRLREMMVDGF